MTAIRRYLPLLNALSGSSPFNDARESGFKCGRLNLFEAMPRTSIPGPLYCRAEYNALIGEYQRMDFISDGSEVWWDIRPSHKYPTVEPRICDVCPRIEDALCIAAIYASLIRMLLRQHRAGALPAEPPTEIIAENKWLAQRYGMLAFLGDTRRGDRIDIAGPSWGTPAAAAASTSPRRSKRSSQNLPTTHERWVARPSCAAVSTSCAKARAPTSRSTCTALRRLEGASEQEALRAVVDLVVAQTGANLDD